MKTKLFALLLALIMIISCVAVLSACGETPTPTPGTGNTPCTSHKDLNKDKKCDVCGTNLGGDRPEGSCRHEDEDVNGHCDLCDELVPLEVEWDNTNLIFQLSLNSDYEELPSGSKRFLAGDLEGKTPTILDDDIKTRNERALEYANVNISYTYLPDGATYAWGESIEYIYQTVHMQTKDSPDFYVNFVYDMVNTSLKGSFANLYSDVRSWDEGEDPQNFFSFAEPGYVDNGEGYMYEYMKSLTLSKFKMYVLASDYLTDVIRAFLICPVDIQLLNSINVACEHVDGACEVCGPVYDIDGDGLCDHHDVDDLQIVTGSDGFCDNCRASVEGYDPDEYRFNSDRIDSETGEIGKDGDFNIDDFYQLVRDKDWTYDTVIDFSAAIYEKDAEHGKPTASLYDQIGFLMGAQGLNATGLIYTTSVTIIKREWDDELDDYNYAYPDPKEQTALYDLCDALTRLFKSEGVYALGFEESKEVDEYSTNNEAGGLLMDIREKFGKHEALFGGIITVGSLEYKTYQDMKEGDGFGVVPVPLYRGEYEAPVLDEDGNETGETYTTTDDYLTCIHNVGRVGGISAYTRKFPQLSAYLHYQSENSTDILNRYYNIELQYSVSDGRPGNVEMLNYIRYNVRSAFDKTYEDCVGQFFSGVDKQSMDSKWHVMIYTCTPAYQKTDMETSYEQYYETKQGYLLNLYKEYDKLPN